MSITRELRMPADGEARQGRTLRMVGGYELFSPLGTGGMGTVFKARHIKSGRIVALKVLPPSAAAKGDLAARFDHEARIACSLSHPNIVEGIASGSVNNLHFYAMELIVGESVADLIARKGRLESGQALKIMWDVAQGLFGAHQAGLIHRDVKPHNLMIGTDGVVKLCDLGLTRSKDDRELTDASAPMGTPFYMSPEQISCDRPIDARTDVYSLGATAYNMVTGVPPYRAEASAKVMSMHVKAALTPVCERFSGADPRLAAVIEKCLRKDPDERYQSMEALTADLHAIQDGGQPAASAEKPANPLPHRPSAARLALAAAARAAAPSPNIPPGDAAKEDGAPAARPAKPQSRRMGARPAVFAPGFWSRLRSLVLTAGGLVAIVAAVVAGLRLFAARDVRSGARTDGPTADARLEQERADTAGALAELTRRAEGSAAAGDFDAALAVLDAGRSHLAEDVRAACDERRDAMRVRAEATLAGVLRAAEHALESGMPDRAHAVLDEASALTYADAQRRMALVRARAAEAKAAGDAQMRRREAAAAAETRSQLLAARRRLTEVIEEFDRAMAGAGPHEVDRAVNVALGRAEFAGQKAELAAMLAVSAEVARLRRSEAEAFDRLPTTREPVALKLADGQTIIGSVTSVRRRGRDLLLIMDLTEGDKHRTQVCRASQLDPAARTALACPGAPRSADERVARAIVALGWRDTATARAMLDGAAGHVLYELYAARLAKLGEATRGR
jgi:hypothetical protein